MKYILLPNEHPKADSKIKRLFHTGQARSQEGAGGRDHARPPELS